MIGPRPAGSQWNVDGNNEFEAHQNLVKAKTSLQKILQQALRN
jgi:hypothetical protein